MGQVTSFLMAFSVSVIFILLVASTGYWLLYFFKKLFPNLKHWIKYKVFRYKIDGKLSQYLKDKYLSDTTSEQLTKEVLFAGADIRQAQEINYIYNELLKVKGGITKNE